MSKLPVVACLIVRDGDDWTVDEAAPVGSVPDEAHALAVPLALFEDDGFRTAVMHRWHHDRGSVFNAIAAELTARLQPELDA